MARVTAETVVGAVRGDLSRADIDAKTHWFAQHVVDTLDVRLTSTGADQVPTDRAYVYMSNHQSHLDIPMLYATLPSPTIRMLAKKELFGIPLFGTGLRAAEFVEVDRGNHAAAVASVDEAARLIRDGVSIWLAPEGTRSRTGEIGKLKKGGFHLAVETGTPIVPVAVCGTINILRRGDRFMRSGQAVHVSIGAPIDVHGRDLEGLTTQVRDFLVREVEGRGKSA
jgi:1-acyl-sn-glycerol-3-phosphate acyltransferase